jgi:Fe-S-cluster containining protein
VDFDRSELASEGGTVPDGLALDLVDRLCRMRGTDFSRPRCSALQGEVGKNACCAIYEWRPSPCREFGQLAAFGRGDEGCNRARRYHGLKPLG